MQPKYKSIWQVQGNGLNTLAKQAVRLYYHTGVAVLLSRESIFQDKEYSRRQGGKAPTVQTRVHEQDTVIISVQVQRAPHNIKTETVCKEKGSQTIPQPQLEALSARSRSRSRN